MKDCRSETDVEFPASRSTNAQQHRRSECFCSRATLEELLADDVMEPVLRTAGYEADEFLAMLTQMAWIWSRRNQCGSKGPPEPNDLP